MRFHPQRALAAVLSTCVLLGACSSASDIVSSETTSEADSTVTSTTTSTSQSSSSSPGLEDEPVEETGVDAEVLQAVLEDFVSDTPGGVDALVIRNGVTTIAASGVGSASGEELLPGRPFRAGSLSKTLLATIVMQLRDEAVLDLDATLGTYLPNTRLGADITIRQLLSHKSGIPNYTEQQTFFTLTFADLSRSYEPEDILNLVVDVPGGEVDRYAYSNTNYILLGQLVEHLEGQDINSVLSARILEPLGMVDTFYATAERPAADGLVAGWSPSIIEGDLASDYDAITTGAWTAGSLISTTGDLATFLSALSDAKLVSEHSLAEMVDFVNAPYGLGIARTPFGATDDGYGHGGAIPGYSSGMMFNPVTGELVVVLTNNDALNAEHVASLIIAIP